MIDLQKNTLLREIPDNLLIDDKVVNLAKALQIPLSEMLEWADKINYTINLDVLDEAIVDHLLWESHITWNEGLSLVKAKEQKIKLIQSSVKLHRLKGTPAAIELVMDILNFKGEVSEWFDYDGRPFYFRVLTEQSLVGVNVDQLTDMINEFKNVRSWLENITVNRKLDLGLNIGGASSAYQVTKILPPLFEMNNLSSNIYMGMVMSQYHKTQIEMPPFTIADAQLSKSYGGAFSCWKQTTILSKEVT